MNQLNPHQRETLRAYAATQRGLDEYMTLLRQHRGEAAPYPEIEPEPVNVSAPAEANDCRGGALVAALVLAPVGLAFWALVAWALLAAL
jgi:hypothetical protein